MITIKANSSISAYSAARYKQYWHSFFIAMATTTKKSDSSYNNEVVLTDTYTNHHNLVLIFGDTVNL